MLSIENVKGKNMKKVFIVECYSLLEIYEGKYEGDLVSDYIHEGHIYPILFTNELEGVKKKFDTEGSCKRYIEQKKDSLPDWIWEYRVGHEMVDRYIVDEDFTGVYNKTTGLLTYCEFGAHYDAIRYHIWKHLIDAGVVNDEFIRTKLLDKKEYPLYNEIESDFSWFLENEKELSGDISEIGSVSLLREYIFEAYKVNDSVYDGNYSVPFVPYCLHGIADEYITEHLVLKTNYLVGGQNLFSYKRS